MLSSEIGWSPSICQAAALTPPLHTAPRMCQQNVGRCVAVRAKASQRVPCSVKNFPQMKQLWFGPGQSSEYAVCDPCDVTPRRFPSCFLL